MNPATWLEHHAVKGRYVLTEFIFTDFVFRKYTAFFLTSKLIWNEFR